MSARSFWNAPTCRLTRRRCAPGSVCRCSIFTASSLGFMPGSARAGSSSSRENAMKTFVLVHGGWHGGWCYRRVADRLTKAGHRVFTPTLTGVGERAHLMSVAINLRTHVTDVVNVIKCEDLTDVVLLGHSYGGLVISEVVERVPESISTLVY